MEVQAQMNRQNFRVIEGGGEGVKRRLRQQKIFSSLRGKTSTSHSVMRYPDRAYLNNNNKNTERMNFEKLSATLARAIDNDDKSRAFGANLSPDNAEQLIALGDYLRKRGVSHCDVLAAIMTASSEAGFVPHLVEKPENVNLRVREALLDQLEQEAGALGLKKSQLLDQYLTFFFERFEGVPDSEPGYVLLGAAASQTCE